MIVNRVQGPVFSALLLLLCWMALSALLTPELLPGPWQTFTTLANDVQEGEIWFHLGTTLLRVAASFVLAMTVGTVFGVGMGVWPRLDALLNPLLVVGLNIPVLIVSVVLYIALGLTETAAILAVALNKIPIVIVMLREGTKSLDVRYFELSDSFRLRPVLKLRRIVLPQLFPYLMAASRSGLALIWKIVLVVEFLGRGNGIGFQIHLFFQDYDIVHVLSYTLLLIGIMLLIDYLIMQPLDRGLFSWRTPHGGGN